ncbi:NusA-like transcription termination signal-binding factor [Candidatus Woesearchaeota archaeon CG10_big_fil_rev_8_21_14_0_10_30_7]|nr:MAG: NusA-like transcription termination signal-binding factor [Candidatus Woesearchaeota archaeon CG10_big_fil_rev_8_21_14_0_10_30_7]
MKYDMATLQFMNFFETLTKSKLKDCFEWNNFHVFVVEQGEIGKAIGKKGQTVSLLQKKLKKRVKIVEYSPELKTFINNLVSPLKLKAIEDEEGVISLIPEDTQTRAILIGRNASSLRALETIIKRYFKIIEVKVLKTWEKNQGA